MNTQLCEQCSDPDRNHFRQSWLVGIIPNPYDRTSASCASFDASYNRKNRFLQISETHRFQIIGL